MTHREYTPSRKLSKQVTEHPAVEECLYAPDQAAPDYKYDVFLKEGWVFKNGRNAGGRGCMFKTVADFKFYQPIRKEEYEA